MNNADMKNLVKNQLAIDYNCKSEDFDKDGIIITEAKKDSGRRKLPFLKTRCEMITMGNSLIVNVSKDIMPFVEKRLKNRTKYEVLNMPFVYGLCHYYLPDISKFEKIENSTKYCFKLVEQNDIHSYYKYSGFENALHYAESVTPEILGIAVFDNEKLVGMCCATKDSDKMCQIGVDILKEYRHQYLATISVKLLTKELLNRDLIPYYFTDNSNIASQKTAVASGYFPAWNHCFKTRLKGKPYIFVNYLKY